MSFPHSVPRDHILLEDLDLAIALLEESMGAYIEEPSHRILLAEALQKRAGKQMLLGDNAAAEIDIGRLQEIAPESLYTATTTSVYWLNQNQLLNARDALSGVTQVDQILPIFRRISARIFLGEGRPGLALEAMGDIAHESHDILSSQDASLIATAHAMTGEWEQALILYNLAESGGIPQQVQLASSHFHLAMNLSQSGSWRESGAHLEYLKEDDRILLLPFESQFWTTFLFSLSALKAGDGNSALTYLEQIHDMEDDQFNNLPNINDLIESGLFEVLTAYAHSLNESHQLALELLEDTSSVFRSITRNLEAWIHNAMGYKALNNRELWEAVSHFESALSLMPNDPSTLNNLACALSHDEQHGEALNTFQSLSEENSLDIAHYNFAVLTERVSSDQQSAYQRYLRYIETGDDLALEEATMAVENKETVFGFTDEVSHE
jgi:tetratricopeptide (TPR) repeat protein